MIRLAAAESLDLLDRSRVEIKLGAYGVAASTALSDSLLLPQVQEYRRLSGSRVIPLDRSDILTKIPAADYHVSRKIDGEFTVLVFRNGQACSVNPGGTVRVGLPWLDEAAECLKKANVRDAIVAGELYVDCADRRPRVHDVCQVARQPSGDEDLGRLCFAVFDLMSMNGAAVTADFQATWKTIEQIFNPGKKVHPVCSKRARSAQEIATIFEQWVEKEGAEGVVVRSDSVGIFKIKPRHTLDAAVIGFTEATDDRQGMMHDLLLAVMRHDGAMQVLCRVGGGFSEDQRRAMLSDLKDMVVDSEYAEVNSDHVAYQMVHPDWVVEISCLDLISQNTRGGPIQRMVLHWEQGRNLYQVVRRLPLASVISPQFIRRRDDKSINPNDIRIAQVGQVVEVPDIDRDASQLQLPASQILRREVFTKQLKGATMVRKFLMWQTNKQDTGEFPAFVVHYTDFSANRKDPLAREVRISNSREQIEALWQSLQDENVKKGWQKQS